jgi:5'-phosphate synthase pdxT subunit
MNRKIRVGILALQGDFEAHGKVMVSLGAETREIRLPQQMADIDGLIIPGGESTTLLKLMTRYGFIDALSRFAESGKPVFGTCAGAILLASKLQDTDQDTLQLIDVVIERNAYGRQVDSFEAEAVNPEFGDDPVPLVFIRAPIIRSLGNGVNVLLEHNGNVILAEHDNILVATFHPELTNDTRIHRYFLSKIKLEQDCVIPHKEESRNQDCFSE